MIVTFPGLFSYLFLHKCTRIQFFPAEWSDDPCSEFLTGKTDGASLLVRFVVELLKSFCIRPSCSLNDRDHGHPFRFSS